MIIQTLDKAYEVIKKFEENGERAVYLCRMPGDVSGSSYLVTAFNSEQAPREHVIYFMELSVKQQTEDFEECFLKNGFLYLVFRHQEEKKLRNALGEEIFPVAERLAISRSLMDRMVQKNLPDYLLYEALSSENVRVAGDSSVCSLVSRATWAGSSSVSGAASLASLWLYRASTAASLSSMGMLLSA